MRRVAGRGWPCRGSRLTDGRRRHPLLRHASARSGSVLAPLGNAAPCTQMRYRIVALGGFRAVGSSADTQAGIAAVQIDGKDVEESSW